MHIPHIGIGIASKKTQDSAKQVASAKIQMGKTEASRDGVHENHHNELLSIEAAEACCGWCESR